MKTRSTRIKGNSDASRPDQAKAISSLILGIFSVAGAVIVFYFLVLSFTVFVVTNLAPYIYYSLGFAGLMFATLISFYYYKKYRA